MFAFLDDGDSAPGVITTSISNGSAASPANFSIGSNGQYVNGGGGSADWVTPATTPIAALYQIQVDATSGTFDTGTTGTYLDCSSAPVWEKSSGTVTFTVTFREKYGGRVRSTITGITLTGT